MIKVATSDICLGILRLVDIGVHIQGTYDWTLGKTGALYSPPYCTVTDKTNWIIIEIRYVDTLEELSNTTGKRKSGRTVQWIISDLYIDDLNIYLNWSLKTADKEMGGSRTR